MPHTVTLLMTGFVTHDVKRFIVERPKDYPFVPGQATEVAIDDDDWRDEKRPFTFTSLEDDRVLEFTIKRYPEHKGVTNALHRLRPGAKLVLDDVFGAIQYRGSGVFLAGGAGVTPVIAILRNLRENGKLDGNRLIFSNTTSRDIILEREFDEMLGDRFERVLTQEEAAGCHYGRMDKSFLENAIDDMSQPFYICGPPEFVEDLQKHLGQLGAHTSGIVIEE